MRRAIKLRPHQLGSLRTASDQVLQTADTRQRPTDEPCCSMTWEKNQLQYREWQGCNTAIERHDLTGMDTKPSTTLSTVHVESYAWKGIISVSGERSSGPGERRMGECELANAGEWVKSCPFLSGVVANGSKCSHSLV